MSRRSTAAVDSFAGIASANTATEMLEKISADELKDKRFLFIRGEKSLETIPRYLNDLAVCDETIVYQNQPILLNPDSVSKISELFEKSEIAAICFFSPSGAEIFISNFGAKVLHQTKIATIGRTTAEFFERQNLRVDFISQKATAKDFAESLIEFLR